MHAQATRWVHHPTPHALCEHVAGELARRLSEAVRDRGVATAALPGSLAAADVLAELATRSLEWSRVFVTVTDERVVPRDHPDSRSGRLRRHLLRGPARQARIIDLYEPGQDWRELPETWHPPAFEAPFDVVLADLGDDGRIAGLLPRAASHDAARLAPDACSVWPVPELEPLGVTMTPSRLRRTRWLGLLVQGATQTALVDAARDPGPHGPVPVRGFLDRPESPIVLHHLAA